MTPAVCPMPQVRPERHAARSDADGQRRHGGQMIGAGQHVEEPGGESGEGGEHVGPSAGST